MNILKKSYIKLKRVLVSALSKIFIRIMNIYI